MKRSPESRFQRGFKAIAMKYLREKNDKEIASREEIINSQRRTYDGCLKRLDHLFQLKISDKNVDGILLSDEDYAKQKAVLIKEKIRLEEMLNDTSGRIEKWLDIAEDTFDFACNAKQMFETGNFETKSRILQMLGSKPNLKGQETQYGLEKTVLGDRKSLRCYPSDKRGVRTREKWRSYKEI